MTAAAIIPARAGTYALLLAAAKRQRVTIGRFGALPVQAGVYVYTGSACGPGGLRARLRHHLAVKHRLHWHIDYLHRAAAPFEIWYSENTHDSEHAWAGICCGMEGASIPFPRFGASDCQCAAHLFYFKTAPDFSTFEQRLPAAAASRRKIVRVTDITAAMPGVLQRRRENDNREIA